MQLSKAVTCSPKLLQSQLESGFGMVPVGAVSHNPLGGIGGGQAAYPARVSDDWIIVWR